MKQSIRPATLCCAIIIWAFSWASLVRHGAAQDNPFGEATSDSPFGDSPSPSPGTGASDPFGGGTLGGGFGDTPTTDAPLTGASAPAIAEDDPVVNAFRQANPTTPMELTRAIQAMVNLGRKDEALRYLRKLLASSPEENALAAVHQEFGSAFFFQLLRDQELAPEGAQFARMTMQAAYQAARDTARLQQLVQQLNDPSSSTRAAAIRGLMQAGPDAVAPMMQALADPGRLTEHAAIQAGLGQLGEDAIEPLIGTLESPHQLTVVQATEALGQLRARRATPFLMRPYIAPQSSTALRESARTALLRIVGAVPTPDEADFYLERQVQAFYAGQPPTSPNNQNQIVLWRWDENQHASTPRTYTGQEAALVTATRLAEDLHHLNPQNKQYHQLFLSAVLGSEKRAGGIDQPLARGDAFAMAQDAGAAVIEKVLAQALKKDRIAVAIAAVEVLAETADQSVLRSQDARRRPITQALRHSDRRLRFEAAKAILRIDPWQSFPGSSHLVDVLSRAVTSSGERRALVGDPRTQRAQSLVGLLVQSGVEAEVAGNGRQFFQLAASHPDYDFLLLSDALDNAHFKETLQVVRRDPRTASLPVALLARAENFASLRQWVESDPLTEVFPWPINVETLSLVARRLISLAGNRLLSAEEKTDQAVFALEALTRLALGPQRYGFYNVRDHEGAILTALKSPPLTLKSLQLLGYFGSSQAQLALLEMASQNGRDLAERQAAALAFSAAVGRRGTMLTTAQIRRQYDRYNRSEQLDRETQLVLGSILDTIEGRKPQGTAVAH